MAHEIVRFARVLRRSGFSLGTGEVHDALKAVSVVGLETPEDFFWSLHAVFVRRAEQRQTFVQIFRAFWSDFIDSSISMGSGSESNEDSDDSEQLGSALAERFVAQNALENPDTQESDMEVGLSASSLEQLSLKDFEKMSAEEIDEARKAMETIVFPKPNLSTRRFERTPKGERIDVQASLRMALRSGSGLLPLVRKRRRLRSASLVVISDISGSMSRYSRMLLHFIHALSTDRDRVYSFVFGTKLTNITRQIRTRNVDKSLEQVADVVEDWSGGTRIGQSLHEFNKHWSRRVLSQGAIVLLITDGLDRDAGEGLDREMDRLHRSCRRLIWLNPLLRYERFEPRSLGMKAMLPYADEFKTVHNLKSLVDLSAVIADAGADRLKGGTRWRH